MIHRYSAIQPPRRNTGLKTILWVLLLCGIAVLCGCHGDQRIFIIIMPIGYMLSTLATMEREEPDFPHGTGGYLQQFCNAWQLTRAGIVICGDAVTAPRLFVPWHSIRRACRKQNCIFLKIKNSDSAFILPCDDGDPDDHLKRIQTQLATKHPPLQSEAQKVPSSSVSADSCRTGPESAIPSPGLQSGVEVPLCSQMGPG